MNRCRLAVIAVALAGCGDTQQAPPRALPTNDRVQDGENFSATQKRQPVSQAGGAGGIDRATSSETNAGRAFLEPLAVATKVTLYSIDPTENEPVAGNELRAKTAPLGERLFGYPVLGSVVISDKERRQAILESLANGIRNKPDEPAKCFEPRHVIKAESPGNIAHYVICFHCSQINMHSGSDIAV
jgi:hypothetical protein